MIATTHALRTLAELLRKHDYEFISVTPVTHMRVNARAMARGPLRAKSLRDVFGWNWPFQPELVPAEMLDCLRAADALETVDDCVRSRVRFSTLDHQLYVHSAFPTTDPTAVFFGPDTYRFASLLARWAPKAKRAVDIGCGTGAGLLSIKERLESLVLADINPLALQYAEVNAASADRSCEIVQSDILAAVSGNPDLIVANPPYLHDEAARVYRHGGEGLGTALGVRIVDEALARLRGGGTLIVYTGTPIVNGVDLFHAALRPRLDAVRAEILYDMLDPDVFGEELDNAAYSDVERIAVVALRVCLSR